MRRILLTVAYDGTGYSGFQAQKSGVPTIAKELDEALHSLTGEEIAVSGASRTDAGVHALCNLVVFDTASRIPGHKFAAALNVRLPEQIRVQCSREVEPDFHPRFCDTVKTYEYRIYNAAVPSPMHRLYAMYSYTPFDVDRMKRAAACLVGTHDFASFCSVYTQAKTTVRTITAVEVSEAPCGAERASWSADEGAAEVSGVSSEKPRAGVLPRMITIRVSGTGFLYNMVRIIAGTLMEVGRGAVEPEALPGILEARDRQKAGPTAPPEGLTLVKYEILRQKMLQKN